MKNDTKDTIGIFLIMLSIIGILLVYQLTLPRPNIEVTERRPIVTITPTATPIIIPTATSTPLPTPTSTPIPIPTITPTPSSTPTVTPTPTIIITNSIIEGFYTITTEELNILYRIVEAEATDGTYDQKKNVTSNIFARVESPDWPNTVKGVVFQKSQYSPISDGRYYSVTVTESTKEAVNYIVQNGKEHNYIYFCSYSCKSSWFAKKDAKLAEKGEECYRDGIHRYYLE